MPQRTGLTSPQNTFLDTIATRFDGTHSNFVLGNSQSKDFPIVYCSDGFVELTGYSRAQIMSRNCSCSFLWGEDTSVEQQQLIYHVLENKTEMKSEIIFYRKDGSNFLCLLDIVPIKNEKDQVVLFLVSHKNLSDQETLLGLSDQETSLDQEDSGSSEPSTANKYQRRRSRAVLYQLSGQYNKKQRFNFSKLRGFHNKRTVPEYKVQEAKSDRLIILHYSLFKIIWDWLILLCTFYIAVFVPYNVVFIGKLYGNRPLFVLDIIVEVLFTIDIILNFRTTYVSKAGQVVYNSHLIAKNYVTGWFVLDLFAAIPFDAMSNVDKKLNEMSSEMQMLKLARLLRLIRLMQKIDRYAQYSFVLLALLMCSFALCAHWLACVWYLIGNNELKNNNTHTISWLNELADKFKLPYSMNGTLGGPGIRSIYISSLYFTCTSITSVGFGNVAPNTDAEKVFSICIMLIGALMHAVIFGNVTAIIQRMYARKATYQIKNQDLKDFTRVHHVPKALKQKMFEFFQTTWAINRGIDPKEVLNDFPEEMRGEICLHLNKEIMSLSIFSKASNACKKNLAQQIKTMFATPGEFLLHRGDAIQYLFFVCSGSLEILDKDGSVVALLGKFDLFGPEAKYSLTRSGFEVRALTYCELQCLNLNCLNPLFMQYPEFKDYFCESLIEELTFNVSESAPNLNVSQESLNAAFDNNASTDCIFLPAISEKEEESKSDDSCPESPDNFYPEYNPLYYQKYTDLRRSSQPDNLPSSVSLYPIKRDRRLSLPVEPQNSDNIQKQLDQLTNVNSNLNIQINHIQEAVEKLSVDIRSICNVLQDNHNIKNQTYSSDISIPCHVMSPSSQCKVVHQNHYSSEPRVTFDLHPHEIKVQECPNSNNNCTAFKNRSPRFNHSIRRNRYAASH